MSWHCRKKALSKYATFYVCFWKIKEYDKKNVFIDRRIVFFSTNVEEWVFPQLGRLISTPETTPSFSCRWLLIPQTASVKSLDLSQLSTQIHHRPMTTCKEDSDFHSEVHWRLCMSGWSLKRLKSSDLLNLWPFRRALLTEEVVVWLFPCYQWGDDAFQR